MVKPAKTKLVKEKFVSGQTVHKKSYGFRVLLGVLILLFLGLSFLAKNQSVLFLDLSITTYIQQVQLTGFATLMRGLSFLGNPVPALIVLGLFSVILYVLNRKHDSLFLIFSSVGVTILSEIIKVIVGRPRPDPTLITQVATFTRPDSFPSGHVLLYIGIYGYLLYLCYTRLKKNIFQTVLIGLCLILLMLIGISRIYLGAHWFSDVLGSYLIGSFWIFCVIHLESMFRKTA